MLAPQWDSTWEYIFQEREANHRAGRQTHRSKHRLRLWNSGKLECGKHGVFYQNREKMDWGKSREEEAEQRFWGRSCRGMFSVSKGQGIWKWSDQRESDMMEGTIRMAFCILWGYCLLLGRQGKPLQHWDQKDTDRNSCHHKWGHGSAEQPTCPPSWLQIEVEPRHKCRSLIVQGSPNDPAWLQLTTPHIAVVHTFGFGKDLTLVTFRRKVQDKSSRQDRGGGSRIHQKMLFACPLQNGDATWTSPNISFLSYWVLRPGAHSVYLCTEGSRCMNWFAIFFTWCLLFHATGRPHKPSSTLDLVRWYHLSQLSTCDDSGSHPGTKLHLVIHVEAELVSLIALLCERPSNAPQCQNIL